MNILSLIKRLNSLNKLDRIGPDIISSHWKLHFKDSMLKLCKKKFRYFNDSAEFRAGAYAVTCSHISIGMNVIIRPGTMLMADEFAEIIIEDNVMIGAGVHIYVNNHKFDDPTIPIIEQGYYPSKKVTLKKGCWVGANCVILPGVTIGENAVIGAGSIVNHSIKTRVVAGGNPVVTIKTIS